MMNRFLWIFVMLAFTHTLMLFSHTPEDIRRDFYSCLRNISKISRLRSSTYPKTCLIPHTRCSQNHFGYRFIVNALIRAGVYTFTTSDFLPSSLFNHHRDDIALLNKKGDDYLPTLHSKVDYILPIFSTQFHQDHDFFSPTSEDLKKVFPFFTSYKSALLAPLWMESKSCYFCYDQEIFNERQTIFNLLHFLKENIYNQQDGLINFVFSRFLEKHPVKSFSTHYKPYSYVNFFSEDEALIKRYVSKDLWYGGNGETRRNLLKLFMFETQESRKNITNLINQIDPK